MTEQKVRTRDEQIDDLGNRIEGGSDCDLRAYDDAAAHILEAEARGAAEQRRKDAETCGRWEFEEPEYHAQGMGCGLEDRGIHDRYAAMEYGWDQAVERCIERIPEELYTRPANVAALEARVKELEAAIQFHDRVKAASVSEKIAVGQDAYNRLDAAMRAVVAALKREGGV